MAKRTIVFVVDDKKDHDIISWYETIVSGERSKEVREAIRDGRLRRRQISLEDIMEAIQDLKRSGLSLPADRPNDDLPDELLSALDKLGH